MLNKAYRYAIGYFLLFSLLLLVSGALIFSDKIGFSYESILHYYLGDEAAFIPAKSYAGLLKIILPHIFAFGLFVMVVLHFLIFTQKRNTKEMQIIIALSFFSAFLELFSPFGILAGLHFLIYVKLISFFLFEFTLLYVLFILFKSILYTK
ncbi:hypothetical protein [Sulfurimonas paralvinellae]|uniref:DUF998 domain-containing protein n=1 Tax=Sulfurimonas paralvinellae TaxID=317658 RepID=A0A7M1B834_9BACT|nr:hypothetical protein [Sulfurimonas paralvinellae]QOP45825.1 hypothetical protein FM071_05790 [Sulfurimonas paralvinellae]